MHLGWDAGVTYVLAAPSSCEPACASGPALLSSRPCSPRARRQGRGSWPRPRAVALRGSHRGFAVAVVGALPLAAGCLRLHARRLPQMLARLSVLKLERRGCGSPNADGGTCVAVGPPAPRRGDAAGRAACSCLAPRPWLRCLGGTRRTDGLKEIKQLVLLCDGLTGDLGAEREEDEELRFLFCICFLALDGVLYGQNHRQA